MAVPLYHSALQIPDSQHRWPMGSLRAQSNPLQPGVEIHDNLQASIFGESLARPFKTLLSCMRIHLRALWQSSADLVVPTTPGGATATAEWSKKSAPFTKKYKHSLSASESSNKVAKYRLFNSLMKLHFYLIQARKKGFPLRFERVCFISNSNSNSTCRFVRLLREVRRCIANVVLKMLTVGNFK